ncbi:DnaJ domain-containing protein [Myxozyma melibiosi]|uniref:DnaJ domain-containing protein n=1 Tax=Myxozyma melibiosi TaxID=54550 RepID=A0ABR1EZ59_9ASCO
MKTCYYELLEVRRDATADEIRKGYRRQALLLHPDKNMDNVEEATQKFALVQAAYEILSDPDEREWYDSHREQILRDEAPATSTSAGASSFQSGTTIADLLRFFDPSLFAIMDDSDIGFFSIARRVFSQLAQEEVEFAESEQQDNEPNELRLPEFGNSKSAWNEEVKYFYSAWSAFSTRKSFAWCDAYNLAAAPERRVRRAMEKENKKLRDAGKREYNDTVRAFVAFIRKRDPRGKSPAAENEQRQQDMAARVKEQAARARAAHRERFKDYEEQEWAMPSAKDEQLWEEEYGYDPDTPGTPDPAGDNYDDDDDDDIIIFECVICNKTFKSEKQMESHEKSKKHLKMVKDVVRRMKKENKAMGLDQPAGESSRQAEEEDEDAYSDEYIDAVEHGVSHMTV